MGFPVIDGKYIMLKIRKEFENFTLEFLWILFQN